MLRAANETSPLLQMLKGKIEGMHDRKRQRWVRLEDIPEWSDITVGDELMERRRDKGAWHKDRRVSRVEICSFLDKDRR